MRISDWSSDVCSSDLQQFLGASLDQLFGLAQDRIGTARDEIAAQAGDDAERAAVVAALRNLQIAVVPRRELEPAFGDEVEESVRSEEHTSELQSLMRISSAVFCLEKTKTKNHRV